MHPHPLIRMAAPSDYDRIITVVDPWWGRSVSLVLPRLFLDHFHETSLVAEHRDELAGFLIGFLSPAKRGEAYIHFVGVAPPHRQSGLARELYERFFEAARANGRSLVCAITSPENTISIAFHRALGFSVTGPVPGYHGPSRDRIVFKRHLEEEPGQVQQAAAV